MLYRSDTYKLTQDLSRFGRSGNPENIPGTTKEGLGQYRRLLRNNINNAMIQAFPIAHQVLNYVEWSEMVDSFFARHDAKTTQIWKLPAEFVDFVLVEDYAARWQKPWLNDLLKFEWLEIEVYTMPDEPISGFRCEGDFQQDILLVNPEYRLVQLTYPVHLFSVMEANKNKGQYFLLVYRHPKTKEVIFVDLSPLDTYVFEKIAHEHLCLKEIAHELNAQMNGTDVDLLLENMTAFVQKMLIQNVILGFAV